MSKKLLTVLAAATLLLIVVIPAAAITYGETDDGEHPYVGFLLFFDPTYGEDGGWFSCSGALLDRRTFLTAGHCTIDIGTDLQVTEGRRGGTDVWVTFDEQVDLSDFPRWSDYDDPDILYPLRFDWLNKNSRFIRGEAWAHPNYNDFAEFPNTYDLGVVLLDKNARVRQYAELAELHVLDELATRRGHNKQLFETAGYGYQEVVPFFRAEDSRYKATSKLVNLESALTDGYNLHTSNNPGNGNGTGGACFGDSGGPVMFNDTNVIVSVVSFGLNYNCKGADFSYRVDIPDAWDFIDQYLP